MVRQLFDHESWTYSYLVFDPFSLEAVCIDPVLEQHKRDLNLIRELGLTLCYVLETHFHTDHQTGAEQLVEATGAKMAMGRNSGSDEADLLLDDGQELRFGAFVIKALATPGHTQGCMSFLVNGMLFSGDTLFIRSCGEPIFIKVILRRFFKALARNCFSFS